VVEPDAQALRRQDAARRAANEHRLEPMRGWYAAGDVQDLSKRDAERNLGDAAMGDRAGDLDQNGAAKARAPVSGKPAMPPVRMVGTAAKVCGPWIKVGAP